MLFVPITDRNSFCMLYESSLKARAQLTPATAFGPVAVDDVRQPARHEVERFVPGRLFGSRRPP